MIKVTVEITIDGKVIKLNDKEARELYQELHSLYGYHKPYVSPPFIPQFPPLDPLNPWIITCETVS